MSNRETILENCRSYFAENFQQKPFIPGTTYIPVTTKVMDAEDLVHLVDASLDMWLTSGRYGRDFEAQIAKLFAQSSQGAPNRGSQGLLVNSGSSANLVAISSLGSAMVKDFRMRPIEKGEEVITAAAGFPTTVNPIIQNGWVPVFIDVDARTLNAIPEAIQAARTPKTRAVVLAHTLGNPYRSDIVAEWCRKEGLYLIEDCCDALGATIETATGPQPVGSFGDFATLSFYPAHHITMGEGGAVIPRDGRWKRIAESMRDWGRDCWCEPGKDNTCGKRFRWKLGDLPCGYDHKYTYSSVGYNLKVTDMQAAVGVSQLRKLDKFVAARRANWKTLNDAVRSSPLLREHLTPVEPTAGTHPSWFGFPIHCAPHIDREKMVAFLEDRKVGTRLLFAGNLTKQPAYQGCEYRIHGSLENTDRIMSKTFWIGTHPALDSARMTYMVEQLEAGIRSQLS
ncbi:MAG: lipopolysaccharide biosynthesis protein RfbH [Oligoflexia bacterium]|nr:lipopolysaccharide biosynthesis protein RfbH [Oligoflexia bacterium]